jgi:MurNAc alpha-1-phosphate uridylyltransferase
MSLSSAMILAAGLGTRMRPLTDRIPKPLVKVAGRTLLDHTLDPLIEAGINRAVVNVHHLADQIEEHLRGRDDLEIIISDERGGILDSGGGCAKALDHLSDPFLIRNADSFWIEDGTPNLVRMGQAFDPERMDTLLLLCPSGKGIGFEGKGDFFLDPATGCLTRRGDKPSAPFVYAGAAMMSKNDFIGRGPEPFSLNALWNASLAKGRLHGLVMNGLWLHVGTIEGIAEAEAALSTCA